MKPETIAEIRLHYEIVRRERRALNKLREDDPGIPVAYEHLSPKERYQQIKNRLKDLVDQSKAHRNVRGEVIAGTAAAIPISIPHQENVVDLELSLELGSTYITATWADLEGSSTLDDSVPKDDFNLPITIKADEIESESPNSNVMARLNNVEYAFIVYDTFLGTMEPEVAV